MGVVRKTKVKSDGPNKSHVKSTVEKSLPCPPFTPDDYEAIKPTFPPPTPPVQKVARSAETGRFVTFVEAMKNKATTIIQKIIRRK